jgi:hypothetical protein
MIYKYLVFIYKYVNTMNRSQLKLLYGKIISLNINKSIALVLLTTDKGYIIKYKPTYLNFPKNNSWKYLEFDEYAQKNMKILTTSIQ